MMKALTTFIIFLFLNTTAFADHLMKLPPEKALSAHKFRVDLLPIKYNQLIILKAKEIILSSNTIINTTLKEDTHPNILV